MKTLILTEKPSVAKDFAKALQVGELKNGYMESDRYIITWAVGHLVELLEPQDYDPKWSRWDIDNLPIIPEEFRYKPLPQTEKQLEVITSLLSRESVKEVIISTDAGREGEVIARSILIAAGFSDKNATVKRFWTSQALTPEVIRDGLKSVKPISEYDRLWKAGHARQIADWLIGMNMSRAATVKMKDLFSVGRVQTAVLSLLVDRRREREHFKPEPFWILKAVFSNHKGRWGGTWFNKKQTRLKDDAQAQKILDRIQHQTGKVASVRKQKKKQPPPLLYSLTELQRDANNRFGFSAQQTLDIAQSLYEDKKCLSYPRTDANVLGTQNIDMIHAIIKKLSKAYPNVFQGKDDKLIAKSNKRVFNDTKLTDHHALIPLAPLPDNSTPDEHRIYWLVLRRFAAAFYPDCEYEQTDIITEVDKETFKTIGRMILKYGWRKVYEDEPPEKTEEDESEAQILPPIEKDDPAHVDESRIDKRMTTAPPEYTEATLLKDMTHPSKYVADQDLKKIYKGDTGLGTQSTRAATIETLVARQYIERQKKNLIATDKGCHLIDVLRQFQAAKSLASAEETARWERQLNLIAQGHGSDHDFLDHIKTFVWNMVEEFKKSTAAFVKTKEIGNCPVCGGKMIEGKRGFGCSNWKRTPDPCRFVIWKTIAGKMITLPMVRRLLEKKQTPLLNGFISEDGNRYAATLKIVNSEDGWQVRVEPQAGFNQTTHELGQCPVCGEAMTERSKGYHCSHCRFVIWKTIAEKEITREVAVRLLENGITDWIEGFKSKKGSLFSARLKLELDETGFFKTAFDFSR